jgi:hypothetical protein
MRVFLDEKNSHSKLIYREILGDISILYDIELKEYSKMSGE